MRNVHIVASAALISLLATTALANPDDSDIKELRQEINNMRQAYEGRIAELEAKLAKMEKEKPKAEEPVKQAAAPVASTPALSRKANSGNAFNPSIGAVLNGRYSNYSNDDEAIAGFGVGEEGLRSSEGFSLGESEISLSSNVDDKFYGSLVFALTPEDEAEVEEAYIQNLPGMGLPAGLSVKAGRSLWTFGYLNEQHVHNDDFADRPLPYRAFLNGAFNDDGAEVSYVLPTDIYTEIGGGAFKGDAFPYGDGKGEGAGAYSGFARVGGDIGDNQSWRVGGYVLTGETPSRLTNDDTLTFAGDSNLYAADLRYVWAPTGNATEKEVIFQSEYFWRDEKGTYNDSDAATGDVNFNDSASGWYAQGVYKFLPQWRVGARYSQLLSPDVPAGLVGSAIDAEGHNPETYSLMGDWSNSEFSRVRLQYNNEQTGSNRTDNQFILQYIMSIGAHGAHKY